MMAYSTRLDDAVAWTMEHFRPIKRKGSGAPYITHLFAVMSLVGEHGGDEEQLMAALLHDAIEDIPGVTEQVLAERFGERVARMVAALSDCMGEPKPPWRARKEHYLLHLRDEPAEVKLISCADKLHNARSILIDLHTIGPAIYERFTGKRAGTLWYYGELPGALGHGWSGPLLVELERVVAQLRAGG